MRGRGSTWALVLHYEGPSTYACLAILICAMGKATPVAAGEGAHSGKRGWSWWKEPVWMVIIGKAWIKRVETVGGAFGGRGKKGRSL